MKGLMKAEPYRKLKLDNAATDGNCHRFGPVVGLQLFHNVLDVTLNRFLANEEHCRNIDVAIAMCDLFNHFDLSPA